MLVGIASSPKQKLKRNSVLPMETSQEMIDGS